MACGGDGGACSVAMENGQLREQLQAAEQASAARRASPLPPTPITAGKGGATAAPDKAQLGELIPAYRGSQAIGAHMQQSTHNTYNFGASLLSA